MTTEQTQTESRIAELTAALRECQERDNQRRKQVDVLIEERDALEQQLYEAKVEHSYRLYVAKQLTDEYATERDLLRQQFAQARALFNVLDIGCDVNIKPSGPDYAVEVVSNLPRIGPAVVGFSVESSLFDAVDKSCKQAVADLQARLA